MCDFFLFVVVGEWCLRQSSAVGDGSMIGMKAILEEASVEGGSIVAAGAIVTPGTVVPSGQVCFVCICVCGRHITASNGTRQ